jgi:threonine/homoserine/homoserine lactone efflux protein
MRVPGTPAVRHTGRMLVPVDHLMGFALAAIVIIAVPGPSVLFLVGRALGYGRAVALLTVLGNTLGLAVVMVLVALGLGAIVTQSVLVFTVVKLVGAAYLIWLGVQTIRHRGDRDLDGPRSVRPLSSATVLRQGFVVGVSNPKAFMMFAAVLPQFVDRGGSDLTAQLLLLGAVAVVIGLLSDSLWAVVAARLRAWFAGTPGHARRLGVAGGVSIIGVGVALAATGRPE